MTPAAQMSEAGQTSLDRASGAMNLWRQGHGAHRSSGRGQAGAGGLRRGDIYIAVRACVPPENRTQSVKFQARPFPAHCV